MKHYNKDGFTLVELMVVIAIIGLLSSVVLASLNSARARGRDAERLSDLHQIQLALEVYYSTYGTYPLTYPAAPNGNSYWGICTGNGFTNSGATGWIPNLAPTFIPTLPEDPNPIYDCYRYISGSGSDYMIMAGTVETYTATNNPIPRLIQPTNFALYSPSAGANSTAGPPGSY